MLFRSILRILHIVHNVLTWNLCIPVHIPLRLLQLQKSLLDIHIHNIYAVLLVFLYTGLLIVEAWLMVRFAKIGPSSLGTGAYHHEQAAK